MKSRGPKCRDGSQHGFKHRKFYRLAELHEVTNGPEFYSDFQRNDDNKTSWTFVTRVLKLKTHPRFSCSAGSLFSRTIKQNPTRIRLIF